MHIANPIYDVVFKYLMADSKIAKLLIGSIIGEEITELDFFPQEHTVKPEKNSLTVYRIDFIAKIKTEESYKTVLIEIQKAKFSTDIMRFRKYLGSQYANKENSYQVQDGKRSLNKALPIVSIYFLGYPLEKIVAPVIKVKRHYHDLIDNDSLIEEKAEFIESLTHDSFVIQIPYLGQKFRNDLECLLSVFDQHNAVSSDHHILNVKEENFPEKYREVIRRLQAAIAEPEVQETMDIEDEIMEELQDKEREIARQDETIAENQKVIAEKDKALEEKDKALQEKDKALQEKEAMIKELMEKLGRSEP